MEKTIQQIHNPVFADIPIVKQFKSRINRENKNKFEKPEAHGRDSQKRHPRAISTQLREKSEGA